MRNHTLFVLAAFVLIASPLAHSAEKKGLGLTVLNSMERIPQNQKPSGPRKADIQAARNEVESFQVVVAALEGNIRVVRAEMSDLVGKDGARIRKDNITLFREEYVRVRRSTPRAELPPGL